MDYELIKQLAKLGEVINECELAISNIALNAIPKLSTVRRTNDGYIERNKSNINDVIYQSEYLLSELQITSDRIEIALMKLTSNK